MTEQFRRGVGERLKEGRKGARLTQEEVATLMGLTRQTVSTWERGESVPTVEEMMELGMLYGQSLDFIVYGIRDVPQTLAKILSQQSSEETRPPIL